jgi:hypothetical protein
MLIDGRGIEGEILAEGRKALDLMAVESNSAVYKKIANEFNNEKNGVCSMCSPHRGCNRHSGREAKDDRYKDRRAVRKYRREWLAYWSGGRFEDEKVVMIEPKLLSDMNVAEMELKYSKEIMQEERDMNYEFALEALMFE